ncbi:MAG TPA: ABC transporter substrate-binding protein [Bryobacteraceae bacterium]|nr:ABC transporter substrate-binding protein [Bryobacteraceae bacterium]
MMIRGGLPLLLVLSAAWSDAASLRIETSTTLRLSLTGDPKTFDALQITDENSEVVRWLTGATLLRVDRVSGEVRPELAESWSIDPKGRAITFRLRSGLRFSDGAPLTSADVARTLHTAFEPGKASPVADVFRSEQGLPEVVVVSPAVLTVRYATTKAGLERLFDELYVTPAAGSASAGPFFVSGYRPGVAVDLKRNPWYWKRDAAGRPLPHLDSIRLDIQTNPEIAVARFERGEIDMLRKLDPESYERIAKKNPAAAFNMGASMDSEFFWFNQVPNGAIPEWKRKWFASVAFRHAISASINREDIARLAYRNLAHAAAGPLSPANRFWFNGALKPLPFDPARALRALHDEGFTMGDGALHDRQGHAVEFSLITNAGNETRERVAALIQSDLSKIGIRVNIVTLDFGTLVERITKTARYEACLLGFTNMAEDPIDEMNVWLSSGPQHAWRPSQKSPATTWEARIDQLVLAQASESSREARRKAFNEVQKILMEQEPVIYLVNPDSLSAVAPGVQGVRFSALFPQSLANIETLRLQPAAAGK